MRSRVTRRSKMRRSAGWRRLQSFCLQLCENKSVDGCVYPRAFGRQAERASLASEKTKNSAAKHTSDLATGSLPRVATQSARPTSPTGAE